jgi:hypothetical protein
MSENITYCQHGVYAIAVWVLTQTAIAFQKGILYTESKSLKIRYCSYTGPLASIKKQQTMWYSIIGLLLDMVGVILLFFFDMPPRNVYESTLFDHRLDEGKAARSYKIAIIGVVCLVVGFGLQVIGICLTN